MKIDLKSLSRLSVEEILAEVDIEEARRTFKETWCIEKPNSTEPYSGPIPPVGSWRYDDLVGFEVLIELPVKDVTPSEPEDGIKNWPGYLLYAENP